jgi:hypothetical protein
LPWAYLVGTTIIVGIGAVLAILCLPLTLMWFRVFRAFAIGAAAVTLLMAVVVLGRGRYHDSLHRLTDRPWRRLFGEGRVARFTAAVERQMLDLVRGNPTRLLVLVTASCASYLLMAVAGGSCAKAVTISGTNASVRDKSAL